MKAKGVYYFRNAERPQVIYAMPSLSDETLIPDGYAYRSFSNGAEWEKYPGDVHALFKRWAQDPWFEDVSPSRSLPSNLLLS